MRRGVSLVELLVTLLVFGLVLGLIVQALLVHERLQRHRQSANAASRAARQATAILASALGDAASLDLVAGQSSDSAVDFMASVGAGVGCVSGAEFRTAATESPVDPTRAGFAAAPKQGDRLLLFDDRSRPPGWRSRTVVDVVNAAASCAVAGVPPAAGITLLLDSALDASPVAAFRLQRRTRYDLYRSGDRRWYVGMREWNALAHAFITVQPVAGPLRAYAASADATGLRFEYFDDAGSRLVVPSGSTRVSRLTVTARPADTTVGASQRSVVLRRAP